MQDSREKKRCLIFARNNANDTADRIEAYAKKSGIPDMKSYIMGAHTLTKRKLTCPKCGAHRYCKKVLTK